MILSPHSSVVYLKMARTVIFTMSHEKDNLLSTNQQAASLIKQLVFQVCRTTGFNRGVPKGGTVGYFGTLSNF